MGYGEVVSTVSARVLQELWKPELRCNQLKTTWVYLSFGTSISSEMDVGSETRSHRRWNNGGCQNMKAAKWNIREFTGDNYKAWAFSMKMFAKRQREVKRVLSTFLPNGSSLSEWVASGKIFGTVEMQEIGLVQRHFLCHLKGLLCLPLRFFWPQGTDLTWSFPWEIFMVLYSLAQHKLPIKWLSQNVYRGSYDVEEGLCEWTIAIKIWCVWTCCNMHL